MARSCAAVTPFTVLVGFSELEILLSKGELIVAAEISDLLKTILDTRFCYQLLGGSDIAILKSILGEFNDRIIVGNGEMKSILHSAHTRPVFNSLFGGGVPARRRQLPWH